MRLKKQKKKGFKVMSKFKEMKDYFRKYSDFMDDSESMEDVVDYVTNYTSAEVRENFNDINYLEEYLKDLAFCALNDARYDDVEEIARAIRVLNLY